MVVSVDATSDGRMTATRVANADEAEATTKKRATADIAVPHAAPSPPACAPRSSVTATLPQTATATQTRATLSASVAAPILVTTWRDRRGSYKSATSIAPLSSSLAVPTAAHTATTKKPKVL